MDSATVVTPPHLARPLRLEPFRALSLSPNRIGDPASARLFSRPYRAVAQRLQQWESRGRMRSDTAPAVYLHEYTATGATVRGLVGAMDLTHHATEPAQRAVLPHEGIHPRQADELADRMEEMLINPAPILLVHQGTDALRDEVSAIAAGRPLWEFDDRGGQHHRVWAIREPGTIERLQAQLEETTALIADGHHRYAAYLRVQSRLDMPPADRGLTMLVDQRDTPLHLGAIHRTLTGVRLPDVRRATELVGLTAQEVVLDNPLNALEHDTLVATDGRTWVRIQLPVTPERTAVELVHHGLLPALPRGPQSVAYHHSVDEALRRRGGNTVTLLMPAPTVEQVLATARAGRLLPEKATSFQPKPHVGVLIRSLRT